MDLALERCHRRLKRPVLPVLAGHQRIRIRRGNIRQNIDLHRAGRDPFSQHFHFGSRRTFHEEFQQQIARWTGFALNPLNHRAGIRIAGNKRRTVTSAASHGGWSAKIDATLLQTSTVADRASQQHDRQHVVLRDHCFPPAFQTVRQRQSSDGSARVRLWSAGPVPQEACRRRRSSSTTSCHRRYPRPPPHRIHRPDEFRRSTKDLARLSGLCRCDICRTCLRAPAESLTRRPAPVHQPAPMESPSGNRRRWQEHGDADESLHRFIMVDIGLFSTVPAGTNHKSVRRAERREPSGTWLLYRQADACRSPIVSLMTAQSITDFFATHSKPSVVQLAMGMPHRSTTSSHTTPRMSISNSMSTIGGRV